MYEPSGLSTLPPRFPLVKSRNGRHKYPWDEIEYPDNWFFGRNKAAYWVCLFRHAGIGVPREWSHTYALLKLQFNFCMTLAVEARLLLLALGLIRVIKPKPRRINDKGRWRRRGDYVIVAADAMLWLRTFFETWATLCPKLPRTILHAWIVRTFSALRRNLEIPAIPKEIHPAMAAALLARIQETVSSLRTAEAPPISSTLTKTEIQVNTPEHRTTDGPTTSSVGPVCNRISTSSVPVITDLGWTPRELKERDDWRRFRDSLERGDSPPLPEWLGWWGCRPIDG